MNATHGSHAGIPRSAWAAVTARVLVPLDIRSHDETIRGEIASSRMDQLTRCQLRASAHFGVRSDQLASGVGSGNYKVAIPVSGAVTVAQHGRAVTLQPGELAVYDTSEPYSVGSDRPFELVIVLIAHDVLGMAPGRVARIAATSLRDERTESIRSVLSAHSPSQHACERTLESLAKVVSSARPSASSYHEPAALRAQAVELAAARLHVEELSPDYLAGMLGVSRRTLYSAFAEGHSTIAATIRDMRLERARVMLESREVTGNTVTEVAGQCGFKDLAHFSRLFRAAYGCPPSRFPLSGGEGPQSRRASD